MGNGGVMRVKMRKRMVWRRVDGVWDGMKILCVGFLSVTIFLVADCSRG